MKPNQPFFLDPIEEGRFWDAVLILDLESCWPWADSTDRQGYGLFYFGNERHRAHRVAYTICFGLIPYGLNVLHSCDYPGCCNPVHLWKGTHSENMKDMALKGRSTFGERSVSAILNETQVLEIRNHYRRGSAEFGIVALGQQYGVSRETIREAIHRKTWAHV